MNIKIALEELRKEEKRKFTQTVDLIVNLRDIDLRRDNITAVISIPHKVKDKKICGFLNQKSTLVKTITKPEFAKYSDKKLLKNLVKDYDFFISSAPLMPSVATTFGKVLGPIGKMPSPQLGIMAQETDAAVKEILDKIEKSVKIRVKEASIKVSIGTESMKDEEIIENFNALYEGITSILPNKKDNIKNIMIKFTMAKPIKIEAK